MSEEELALADLIIEKCPIKNQFSVSGFMNSNILVSKRDVYGEELYFKIATLANSRSSSVRTFLLQQKYLETTNHSIPYDILSDKGEKARELGGHENYKKWEAEQERLKKIQDFPKNKWFIYEPLKYILPLIIGWLIGHFTCNNTQLNNLKSKIIKTSPLPPKTSDSAT